MPVFSADLLLTSNGAPVRNGWVQTDEEGKVVQTGSGTAPAEAKHLQGILVPGFINAHCHLELSFLKGSIARGLGMTGFIRELMRLRGTTPHEMQQAGMVEADAEMFRNGIVAVGDISNATYSAALKKTSAIRYHTFLEVSGLAPEKATMLLEQAVEKKRVFENFQLASGLTPHAPYSVSSELMHLLTVEIRNSGLPLSIHLQESEDELEFCSSGNGPMGEFFRQSGFNTGAFPYHEAPPVRTLLPLFSDIRHLLLVHNTFITGGDIRLAEEQHGGITWCLCPNANLYITGQLPPVMDLAKETRRIAIGTDSLASNDTLSMVAELAVLQQAFPLLAFETLVQWATLNGAKALQKDTLLGSVVPGKKPGLLLLRNINPESPAFTKDVIVERVI